MEQKNVNGEKEWGFQDYISLAIRRKWIILFVFVLVFSAAVAYLMTRPPVYKASATFIIEGGENGVLGGMPGLVFESNARPFGFYKIILDSKQYRSRLVEMARKDSILAHQPDFSEQLGTVLGSLTLTETDYEKLYALSVEANHPVIVYRMASIIIDEFKKRCQEIELEESRNIVNYVNNQIEQARKSLAEAERELQEFKETTRINNLEEENGGILSKLAEIESQLEEVQTRRQLAQANLSAYTMRVNEFKASASPYSMKRPEETREVKELRAQVEELEKQKERYENAKTVPKSLLERLDAKIRTKKVELRNKILATDAGVSSTELEDQENSKDVFNEKMLSEELDLYALKNQEDYLKNLIEKYRQEHPNLLEHAIQLAELQRTKTVNENLYTFLVEKAEEAKINAATGTGGIRIVDEPSLPERPVSNNMKRNLAVSIILACGLGFGLAFAIDFFDNSIYTPDDLKQLGDVVVLGSIPHMRKKEAQAVSVQKLRHHNGTLATKDLFVFEDRMNGYKDKVISLIQSREPVVDAYRHVRTNLQFANIDTSLKRILVTSAIPGEGKTLTAANLAISFAELGKRILVVDCDMRRSHQHILFNIRKSPGLSDYLGRDITIEKAIYMTHVPNLYVIPSGTTPPNPAEMLASNKMAELIKKLDQNFDFVVYDSPPIIAVTDPILLSKRVEHVVMVVRFGKTNRHLVVDSLNRLRNVNSQLLGMVLNGMQKAKGYGYYKYDYAYYQSSYYAEDVKPKKKFSLVN
ncbi:polysaccharide biosynthesis tyrosine autokinase [candidate division KSB1 bacterium]|nr:polysaccharide biosynthesis tyrosine autokinase [candidate division KSB1 bacterium]